MPAKKNISSNNIGLNFLRVCNAIICLPFLVGTTWRVLTRDIPFEGLDGIMNFIYYPLLAPLVIVAGIDASLLFKKGKRGSWFFLDLLIAVMFPLSLLVMYIKGL